ncbi:MAG TPA: 6-carboxytetrahydropterin synthase [Dehalococcoidia bacterium]|nr:6-carboxytetrahydropterin synthase [Dehalococcoidia bacterium]
MYSVRVEGVQFDAAHFATFGGRCEPLHGHSYQVAAEVEGELVPDAWVLDFGRLKALLREIARELDHRFMLQAKSPLLEIECREGLWKVRTPEGLVYSLPAQDVVPLPIDNSTAERLCEWFSQKLWRALGERGANNLRAVTLEVWEGPGQRASRRTERQGGLG